MLDDLALTPGSYLLVTIHRPRNTDTTDRLEAILAAFSEVEETVVFPVHPRTAKIMAARGMKAPPGTRLIEPVGYLDMLQLERNARMIITDSGGVQKEAYVLGVPCITLREETEWVETVEAGWNVLVAADREKIVAAVRSFEPPTERPALFGEGHAAEKIVKLLEEAR